MHGFVQAIFQKAVHQAIGVLHADNAWQIVLLGQTHKLMHTIGRFIGQTYVTHLALLDQLGQSFKLHMDRGGSVFFGGVVVQAAKHGHMALGPMDLVEVNHIGLQTLQTRFTRGHDVRRRHALACANPRHAA